MEFENGYHQIPPHEYPIWIKCGIGFCFLIFALFFIELPHILKVNNAWKAAETAFKSKNYKTAFELFDSLNKQFPDKKYIKLRLAQILFTQKDLDAHQEALSYLGGISLDKYDWKELLDYMPSEYEELFDTTEVKS